MPEARKGDGEKSRNHRLTVFDLSRRSFCSGTRRRDRIADRTTKDYPFLPLHLETLGVARQFNIALALHRSSLFGSCH
jgi:hypothetical protein